jgi:hypothetical protein
MGCTGRAVWHRGGMGAQPPARGKAGKGACETPAALEFLDDVEKLCKLPFESSFSQTSLLGSRGREFTASGS